MISLFVCVCTLEAAAVVVTPQFPHSSKFRFCDHQNSLTGCGNKSPQGFTLLCKKKKKMFSYKRLSEDSLLYNLHEVSMKVHLSVAITRFSDSRAHLPVLCSSGPWCSACSSSSTWQAVPLGTPGIFLFSCSGSSSTVSSHKVPS